MIYNKLQNLSDLKCILIRVDWNKRLGMGHLSRCFELAKKLKKLIRRKNKLNEIENRTLLERNDVYLYHQIILTPLLILN
jgi:hypothetical protein